MEVGAIVELNDVLLVSGNNSVKVGTPLVDGARVIAEVMEHGRDKKIAVFKYKAKVRYRRRHGHRQDYTRLAIRGILSAGEEALPVEEEKAKKRPARKRAAPKAKAGAVETAAPEIEVTAEAPTVEHEAKPRRAPRTSRAAATAEAPTVEGESKPRRAPRTSKSAATAQTKPATRSRRRPAKADESGE